MDTITAINWSLLALAALLLVGIASNLIARRFGTPLLLVFLVIGMLLGEDGPGGIRFEDYALTYALGSLALAVILFDGGLRTQAARMRGALAPAVTLATLGVLLTALLAGAAAIFVLPLEPAQGLLLGAMIASTDAAAVFFLLRSNGLHLRQRIGATLEMESGSNDPAAVFLTLALVHWLSRPDQASLLSQLGWLVLAVGVGVVVGVVGGRMLAAALNRLNLPAGLHPVLTGAGAIAVFALANLLGGSGFLAVYLAGLIVGNRPVRAFASVLSVQDAATWLAQLSMFLLLGLLVTPSHLIEHIVPAIAIAAFLMVVARPLATWLCLWPFGFSGKEKTFVAWVGLRGAVGIFLASVPMLAGLPNAKLYFDVAFVVVLTSLLIQGWTLSRAAHWLGVALPRRDAPGRRVELDLPGQLDLELVGYPVEAGCAAERGAWKPDWAQPMMVVRQGRVLSADQAGALRGEDHAYFLVPPDRAQRLDWLFVGGGEAQIAEREALGSFVLEGETPLGQIAEFYGLHIDPKLAQCSLAQLFAERYENAPQLGDRVSLGRAQLIARQLHNDRVCQVGLKFGRVRSWLLDDPPAKPRRPRSDRP